MNLRLIIKSLVLVAVLVAVTIQVSWAGIVMKERVVGENGQETITTYIEGDKVKNILPNGSYVIIDLTKQEMIEVDPDKKQFSTVKLDEIKKEVNQAMSKIKEQLAGLPPEQRKLIEQMMGGMMGGAGPKANITVKKSGKEAKIAGFKASPYKIFRNGELILEAWISPELKKFMEKELDNAKIEAFEKAMDSLDDMFPFMGESSDSVMKRMQELEKKGFLVKEVDYADPTNPTVVSEIVSVEKKSIPSSEFKVPSGYKKVSWKGMEHGD